VQTKLCTAAAVEGAVMLVMVVVPVLVASSSNDSSSRDVVLTTHSHLAPRLTKDQYCNSTPLLCLQGQILDEFHRSIAVVAAAGLAVRATETATLVSSSLTGPVSLSFFARIYTLTLHCIFVSPNSKIVPMNGIFVE
jgi:hypothetical protein